MYFLFKGYRVGWVNAKNKAILAIGIYVITHNPRCQVLQKTELNFLCIG